MKKKAQFYLIAAIIIVVMIIGLSTISNYIITREEPVKFYDLSEELNEESYRTSEFIIVNEQDVMDNFTSVVARYIKEDVDNFAVFYGDKDSAKLEFYSKEESGEVTLTIGEDEGEEGTSFIVSGRKDFTSDPEPESIEGLSEGEDIAINLLDESYKFKLRKGQNFVFIITKKTKEETHITTR